MKFYVGTHVITHAHKFERCMISINRLRDRKSDFAVNEWILDSGAFTTINKHGRYIEEPEHYAAQIDRWAACGRLVAAVSQDYMCEEFVLAKTGMTVDDHQRLTIERYDAINAALMSGTYLMPVLQGYTPDSYVSHLRQYGDRIEHGAWVGVGSVCKRNGNPAAIYDVLKAIKQERPDINLHGFGIKITSLRHHGVRAMLYTSDSMAWSFAARMEGGDANGYEPARDYAAKVERICSAPLRPWYVQERLI